MKKNNDLYKPVLIITSLFFASQLNAQSLPDSKIKTNSSPIENPVEKVKQLEPLTYEYKTTEYKSLKLPAGKQYGFLADNVLQVVPEAVSSRSVRLMKGKNMYQNTKVSYVNNDVLVPLLVATVKEQQTAIEQLMKELKELKQQISSTSGTN
ncbi:MAG TPA: tail fiber domain-containing protein [Chitinophagaceae bacterium]|nr:tail fiber domain-containing protein [Chitinophagaceae bacterium]HPG11300.1 tail fiber domain-containing protein [Chitinophagaceae bacterium]